MTETYDARIDGRLNAHRRLMVSLFATLASIPHVRDALSSLLEETSTIADHEEDPGIEPDPAFAAQKIADEEIRAILSAAMRRHDAGVAQSHEA